MKNLVKNIDKILKESEKDNPELAESLKKKKEVLLNQKPVKK